jgi:hypothetical protein
MNTTIFYSVDNESFNHDDLGSLIDYLLAPQVGDVYYEADGVQLLPTAGIDNWTVESILEHMDEHIYDEIGDTYGTRECSEVSDEAKVELRQLLEAWATKHIDLSRYWKLIGDSRECRLTTDDLECGAA